jgi:hypothetical protein
MQSFVKSMVLSVGLLAGTLATAQAQSVANLPPTSYVPAPTATTPAASSAMIYPSPGNNGTWQEQHYTAKEGDKDPGLHPYTMPHFSPAPN